MLRRLKGIIGEGEPEKYSVDVSTIDSEDFLLVTDPNAVEKYRKEGKLDELEQDIRFSVMRGRPWQQEELEYVAEIRDLLGKGIIKPKGTWWWASPHPTVYVARKNGRLRIAGKIYKFRKGDEIVFQCQMEREEKNLHAPLIVGHFSPTDKSKLCGDMGTAMKGM